MGRETDNQKRVTLLAGLGAIGLSAVGARYYATRPRPPAGGAVRVRYKDLAPGTLRSVEWLGRIVFVLRRSPADLYALSEHESELIDPGSEQSLQPPGCQNRHRSLLPELFVAIGQCTHQGCTPTLRVSKDGKGEFICPCHTSRYDLAGRVFRAGPAPANLIIPEYSLTEDGNLVVGES